MISRRDFIDNGSMAGISSLIAAEIPGYARPPGAAEGAKTEARIREAENFLRATYAVSASGDCISYEEAATGLSGRELSRRHYAQALGRLSRELEKYPDDAITKLRIRNLRLVEELYVGGKRRGGCTNLRRGTSETVIDIFISADRQYRKGFVFSLFAERPADAEKIHHELYHAWRLAEPEKTVDDEKWSRINPGGKKAYVESMEVAESLWFRRGFACPYGMLNPRDDRATVAELLMSNPWHANFISRRDSVLEAKIRQVKKDYDAWTDGRIDRKYWETAALGPIDRKYWRKLEAKRQKSNAKRIAALAGKSL